MSSIYRDGTDRIAYVSEDIFDWLNTYPFNGKTVALADFLRGLQNGKLKNYYGDTSESYSNTLICLQNNAYDLYNVLTSDYKIELDKKYHWKKKDMYRTSFEVDVFDYLNVEDGDVQLGGKVPCYGCETRFTISEAKGYLGEEFYMFEKEEIEL